MKHTFQLLLVSPENLTSRTVRLALRSSAIDISQVDPASCLLQYCSSHHVDLIIFLTTSPYFSSMNVVESLRSVLQPLPTPPIYVIASSHTPATVLTLLECGVNQYMTLPLNLHRLRNKVFDLIDSSSIC